MEAAGEYVKEIWLVSGWAMGWQVKTIVLYVVVSFPTNPYPVNPPSNRLRLFSSQLFPVWLPQLFSNLVILHLLAGRSGDRIPVGARFSARPERPWGPPSLLYNGYRVFPGGKVRPGRAADHSPPSSAEVLEG